MSDGREGRLARWSRLKRRDRAGGSAPRGGDDEAVRTPAEERREGAPPSRAPAAVSPAPDAEPGPEDLPSIDSLDAGSDYSPFLKEGVPEALARAALRKLWRSDPVLANLDGLNDYDEDFGLLAKAASATVAAARAGGSDALETETERQPDRTTPGTTEAEESDRSGTGTAASEEPAPAEKSAQPAEDADPDDEPSKDRSAEKPSSS